MLLEESDVDQRLEEVLADFDVRHQRIKDIFEERFEQIRPLLRLTEEAQLIAEGNFNQATYDYGYAHEAELWKQFRAEMGGEDASRWLYGSSRRDGRLADLGYFMGFRIAQAYYDRAEDKQQAVRDLLTSGDFEGILQASRYGEDLK